MPHVEAWLGGPVGDTWRAPSVGFHVTHLAGGLDRLLTYARGELLTDAQLAAAGREDRPVARSRLRPPCPPWFGPRRIAP